MISPPPQGSAKRSLSAKGLTIRPLRVLLASAACFGLIWHLLPLGVWMFVIEPDLRAEPGAHRLDVPVVESLPEVPAAWSEVVYEGLRLRAPLADSGALCPPSEVACFLLLQDSASLSVHPLPPGESYRQMVNLRAPDRDDLSLFRWPSDNWATIQALRTRVTTSRSKLDSWRYEADHTLGVVASSERSGIERQVVAVYDRRGERARVVGLAGVSEPTMLAILASIRFVDEPGS
jgi:hypothetical protein